LQQLFKKLILKKLADAGKVNYCKRLWNWGLKSHNKYIEIYETSNGKEVVNKFD
jgi:hypothetical protein